MNINWYPGHMKKTRESLIEMSKLVDIVIELIDARAPMSSTNPIIKEIGRFIRFAVRKSEGRIHGWAICYFTWIKEVMRIKYMFNLFEKAINFFSH